MNGIPFINQTFIEDFFEQPPYCFHVFVVVGDVGVIHIHPVPHFSGKVIPHIRILHNRFSACIIVFFNRNGLANIFLGNAQFFLRQAQRAGRECPILLFDLLENPVAFYTGKDL